MASDGEVEIYRALRESQTRYVYFLLAASGAAIALAVNQTHGSALAWSQLPLGAAVVAWGLSFFAGCRHIEYSSSIIHGNAQLFDITAGRHPLVGPNPQRIAAAREGAREALDFKNKRGALYGRLQFWLLVSGGLMYLAWHFTEMYLKLLSQP